MLRQDDPPVGRIIEGALEAGGPHHPSYARIGRDEPGERVDFSHSIGLRLRHRGRADLVRAEGLGELPEKGHLQNAKIEAFLWSTAASSARRVNTG